MVGCSKKVFRSADSLGHTLGGWGHEHHSGKHKLTILRVMIHCSPSPETQQQFSQNNFHTKNGSTKCMCLCLCMRTWACESANTMYDHTYVCIPEKKGLTLLLSLNPYSFSFLFYISVRLSSLRSPAKCIVMTLNSRNKIWFCHWSIWMERPFRSSDMLIQSARKNLGRLGGEGVWWTPLRVLFLFYSGNLTYW